MKTKTGVAFKIKEGDIIYFISSVSDDTVSISWVEGGTIQTNSNYILDQTEGYFKDGEWTIVSNSGFVF